MAEVPSVDEQYNYALHLVNAGKTDKAMMILQNVLISNPAHADARNDLGVLYFHKGELEQALINLEAALSSKDGDPGIISNLAEVFRALGREKEADNLLRRPQ